MTNKITNVNVKYMAGGRPTREFVGNPLLRTPAQRSEAGRYSIVTPQWILAECDVDDVIAVLLTDDLVDERARGE